MEIQKMQRIRCGFTLIELLVVILIIGMLAGFVTAGAMGALKRARVANTTMEIKQIDAALQAYKQKFGEYPPDGINDGTTASVTPSGGGTAYTVNVAFLRHFQRMFPKANLADELNRIGYTSANCSNFFSNLTPATALGFFLGGIPENLANTNSRLIGFSTNPLTPFDNTSSSRIGPFYEFKTDQLGAAATNTLRYAYPPLKTPTRVPYIYFRAEPAMRTTTNYAAPYYYLSGGNLTLKSFLATTSVGTANVYPYYDIQESSWVKPTSFQILCAGQDGDFCTTSGGTSGNCFPTGLKPSSLPNGVVNLSNLESYTSANNDDQTNFSDKGTIGDEKP